MDSSSLSSNWKKLQEQLRQKKDQPRRGTKRKADGPPPEGATKALGVKRRMGALLSKVSPSTKDEKRTQSTSSSSIIPANGSSFKRASVADLPAALASPTTIRPTDVLNGGRTQGLEPGKYVALDCEMVGVGPHPETSSVLARASLVDYHGTQLYDSFVLPMEPITDFRTAVSGITPALLKEARTFDEVQRDVADLLKGRILVGHAVRNDLKVLMLGHPKSETRDTGRHGPHRELVNGAKPGLKLLASELLGVDIQSGSHSSVEDARVTMALFRRDKAAFESEAAANVAPKPKAVTGGIATNGVRGTKRTGAKNKKKRVRK